MGAAAPAPAEPPPPEGIPAGPWILVPVVAASYGYDSNILLQSDALNPVSDQVGRARAAMTALLPFRQSLFTVGLSQDWRLYKRTKLSQNGSLTGVIGTRLKFSTWDTLEVSGTATKGIADTYLFDPGGELAFTAEPYTFVQLTASASRDVTGHRGYLVRVSPQSTHFDQSGTVNFFDSDGVEVEGEYREPLTSRVWAVANVELRDFDHFCFGTDPSGNPCQKREAPFRRERDASLYGGIRGYLAGERPFFFKIGWGASGFEGTPGSNFRGVLWDGSFRLLGGRSMHLDLTVQRKAFPSFYGINNYYLWDEAGARYEFERIGSWGAGTYASLSRAQYPEATNPTWIPGGAPRRDTSGRLEAYATLFRRERSGVRLNVVLQRRRSNDIYAEYHASSVLLGLFFGWI